MNYENEKFLPIGTVVLLKNATKKVMITGYLTVPNNQPNGENKIYDYSACLYPEGVLDSNQSMVFNHEQIAQVYFVGYNEEEEKNFMTTLKQAIVKDNLNN